MIQIQNIQQHYQQLHKSLDEVLAYFMKETGKTPSQTTALELLEWVYHKMKGQNHA
jgi:hypothetical protein